MKKLLTATLVAFTMAFSGAAIAHSEWYGKEGQDETSAYMDHALSRLPAQKAADFRETMKNAREENKDLEEKVHGLHGDLHTILTAPDFDKKAFLEKRTEIQQLHDQMEANRTEAFASAVSELSQKERVALTRSLDHAKKHHRHMAKLQGENGSVGTASESIKH